MSKDGMDNIQDVNDVRDIRTGLQYIVAWGAIKQSDSTVELTPWAKIANRLLEAHFDTAYPTQNPHTEEGEKEKCSKCGEAADTHSTICKREPILPGDNTDVAIPEEIEQFDNVWDAWEAFEIENRLYNNIDAKPHPYALLEKNHYVVKRASAEWGAKWMRQALDKELKESKVQIETLKKEKAELESVIDHLHKH